jgi:cysteinyl-tRNA synthetase
MTIRVYNTLTRTKEPFEPVEAGRVGIYLCGPTVYKEAHIGHMVGPVIFDTVKRYLVYSGYQVRWVVNITDVDDKLIAQANQRGIPMAQVAEEMTADYLANLRALGVDQIDDMPKATEHIQEIIEFIQELIAKKFAYASDGDVFFDVGADPNYGKLSNRSADSQQGEGGEAAARKRSASDFALWKAAKEGEPSWPSPWGPGRPGWHIECSAMSRGLLGKTFDIHGGGLDLVFPHHENELAQSECCHGQPMVKYWMHNGLMRAASAGKVGGRGQRPDESAEADAETKISRSKGAGGLAELIQRQGGQRLRFFLLRTHYRSTIVFGEDGIQESGTALEAFQRFFERYARVAGADFYALEPIRSRVEGQITPGDSPLLQDVQRHRDNYLTKMDDDFNTGAAISELFDLLRTLNKFCDQQQLEDQQARQSQHLADFLRGVATLRELTALLGLFLEGEQAATGGDDQLVGQLLELLIELRAHARQNKDFAMADRVRDGLAGLGITLEDRKEGTGWRRE